ncbi:MAG: hypothetical protein CMH54_09415 [Myxococcales bacterium]|nr:hypothetical protein [Myxococcales bacterium]
MKQGIAVLCCLFFLACSGSGSEEPAAGELGGPCLADGTCNTGLACEENLCIESSVDDVVDSDSSDAQSTDSSDATDPSDTGDASATDAEVSEDTVGSCTTDTDCEDENSCTLDLCVDGACFHQSLVNLACNDGDACTLDDSCKSGGVCAGTPKDCSNTGPCLAPVCNPDSGLCDIPTEDGISCDDEDICNGNEVCQAGVCEAGTPVDCSGQTDPCLAATCNPGTGSCDLPLEDGTACLDTDLCNGSESCQAGVCTAGTAVDCSGQLNPCLATTCNPVTGGCDSQLDDGTACEDGDLCNGPETCQAGECTDGSPVVCEPASGVCEQNSCNATSGVCELLTVGNCCGNGVVEPGEECDDGGPTNACTAVCTQASCGDGIQNGTETDIDCGGDCPGCAQGLSCAINEDCFSLICIGESCQFGTCGDNVVQSDEECDDGDTIAEVCPYEVLECVVCSASCQFEAGVTSSCGDSILHTEHGESCDDGGESASCNADCTASSCGDGTLNTTAGEACDGGGESATCNADCTVAACGDGTINVTAGESCDDTYTDSCGTCNATCTGPGSTPLCGDGDHCLELETCDDGNLNPFDGCTRICTEGAQHLLLSEVVVTPTGGEFVEIYNPTSETVSLSGIHVSDFNSYYTIAGGSVSLNDSDFLLQFPGTASIAAHDFVVVSLESATAFFDEYGFYPDFDLDPTDTNAPVMFGGSGTLPGLTNGDEIVILFFWDGSTDYVTDLDYLVWGNTSDAMDKSGATVGSHTYLNDTAAENQAPVETHGSGQSLHRCDIDEGSEVDSGGNGQLGHDETSENFPDTWRILLSPRPGEGPPAGACD